jgi:hypothetical protein
MGLTSFQLRHEGVRSSPQPIGYSVAAGIRDGWHAGRRNCTTRYSDRLAGREHLRHWSRAMRASEIVVERQVSSAETSVLRQEFGA